MAWREVIYEYDGSFDGFCCCIFESYTQKELPTAILLPGQLSPCLFDVRTVPRNDAHVRRVQRSLQAISPDVLPFLRRVHLTCLTEKEVAMYRFVRKLYREGAPLLHRLHDKAYQPLLRAVRRLNGEVEQYRGFVRFSEIHGVLTAEIEPKNRVLPLLRGHFCQRCRNDAFFLYDRTHREALFYADGHSAILPLDSFVMAPPDEEETAYRRLWRCFYDTVAIRERENPKLRMTHMPKRYWSLLTELQEQPESTLPAASPRAAFPARGVPAATPAPAIPPAHGQTAPASSP